ncbi:MAG: NUDIX domain-containing protein [Candidatus Jorgensenbacteria bacterium]
MIKDSFEFCARAVIERRGKVLACWSRAGNHYFFPGGHVNFGETAEEALSRELKEELKIKIGKMKFIGTNENIYTENKKRHHEINAVFSVAAASVSEKSREDHIDFTFMTREEFKKSKVLPLVLQKAVLGWLKDRKLFWASRRVG